MGEGEGRNSLYYLLLYYMLYYIAVLYIFGDLRTTKSNYVIHLRPLNIFLSLYYCLSQNAVLHVSHYITRFLTFRYYVYFSVVRMVKYTRGG